MKNAIGLSKNIKPLKGDNVLFNGNRNLNEIVQENISFENGKYNIPDGTILHLNSPRSFSLTKDVAKKWAFKNDSHQTKNVITLLAPDGSPLITAMDNSTFPRENEIIAFGGTTIIKVGEEMLNNGDKESIPNLIFQII